MPYTALATRFPTRCALPTSTTLCSSYYAPTTYDQAFPVPMISIAYIVTLLHLMPVLPSEVRCMLAFQDADSILR